MATPEGQTETRAELYGEEYPDLPVTERLVDIWRDLGPGQQKWSEIEAFTRATGVSLISAETRCLVEMSRAFGEEYSNCGLLRKSPLERDQ